MSTFGWFALIILPILGGLIAWAGDVIGYRLGKARRSLFGLRPRTTARVIGVAVGVLLPLISMWTASLGSRDVQDALFHLDALRRERTDLEGKNQHLAAQAQQLEQQVKQAEQRTASAELQAHRSEALAKEYRAYLDGARASLGRAQAQVAQTRQRLSAAQGQLQRAQALVTEQSTKRRELQMAIAKIQAELSKADRDLARAQEKLAASRAEFDRWMTDARTMLASPVVLESGHTLVRVILPVGANLQETEDALVKLLVLASEAAHAQGAEAIGGPLAVRLIRPLPPNLDLPPDQLPNETDVLRAFAQELQAAGKRQFVVEVRVARPMYRVEVAPVLVEMKAWPFVRVFVENEVIYSVTIDGSSKRSEVFNLLYNLVTKIVHREAQERGLLPDPKTGEYGGLPADQLLDALDQVLTHKGPVKVQVVAAADTFVSDPLTIKVEVGKEEKQQREQDNSGG